MTDATEKSDGTNPNKSDTDGDGVNDGTENRTALILIKLTQMATV